MVNPFAGGPTGQETEAQFGQRMLEHERRDAKTMCPINTYYPDHVTKRHTLRLKCPVDAKKTDKTLNLQQKKIVSHLTVVGPGTVRDIASATGLNIKSVASNMSSLHKSNFILKLENVRVNGKTVATGRRDCWLYGASEMAKEV